MISDNSENTNTGLARVNPADSAITLAKQTGLLDDDFRKKLNTRDLVLHSNATIMVRDLQNDEPIKDALKYVFDLLGMSTAKVNETKVIIPSIIKFLHTHQKDITPDEIKTAFELAIVGTLGTLGNKNGQLNLELYDKPFSSSYLSAVINRYKKYRFGLIREAEKQKREEIERQNRKQKSEAELKKIDEEFLMNTLILPYEKFCQDDSYEFPDTSAPLIYDRFKKEKLIDLTTDELNEIYQKAEKEIKFKMDKPSTSLEQHMSEKLKSAIRTFGEEGIKGDVIWRAKEIALLKIIKNFKEKKVNLREKFGIK